MKRKNLNKRIQRLEASIARFTKKLVKLRGKLTNKSSRSSKKAKPPKKSTPSNAKPARASAPKQKKKKKRHLSPEAREKLATRMKERWAAKKASAGSTAEPASETRADAGSPS